MKVFGDYFWMTDVFYLTSMNSYRAMAARLAQKNGATDIIDLTF